MPIYEYRCEACGHEFETLLKTAAEAPVKCPVCGKAKLKKKFSAFAAKVAAGCRKADSCPVANTHKHSGGCCGTSGGCGCG
jgi:putative FmdB family regulatory protein